MKKFLKKSVITLMFAFAFLFVGVGVNAAVNVVSNNTTMGSNVKSYKVGENQQYVVNDSAETAKITLNSVKSSTKAGIWIFKNEKALLAKVTVVRCGEIDKNNQCTTWYSYSYSEDKTATMDALKKDGLVLSFQETLFKPALGITQINGVTLNNLNGIHGLSHTYFILVQYEAYRPLVANDIFDAEVYKVVFAHDMKPLTVTAADAGENVEVNATSGLPIASVRYFYSDTKIEGVFDFETEYNKSGNGVAEVVENGHYAAGEDNEYTLGVTFSNNDGKYYYVEATDVAGNKVVYDVHEGLHGVGAEPTPNPIFTSTPVGKIILGVLITVLVIALVLVIVQKIIDKKKKIY